MVTDNDSNTRPTNTSRLHHGGPPYLVIKNVGTAAHLIAAGFSVGPIPSSERGDGRWKAPFEARAARDHYERIFSAIQAENRRQRETGVVRDVVLS